MVGKYDSSSYSSPARHSLFTEIEAQRRNEVLCSTFSAKTSDPRIGGSTEWVRVALFWFGFGGFALFVSVFSGQSAAWMREAWMGRGFLLLLVGLRFTEYSLQTDNCTGLLIKWLMGVSAGRARFTRIGFGRLRQRSWIHFAYGLWIGKRGNCQMGGDRG